MNAKKDTPATTTLVFETSHEARTAAAGHLATIAKEAGMTRTDAHRNNETGTDHATWTLEVPADQADDTGRSIAHDLTANGIRTTWYDASEPGPDQEEPTETLTLTTPDTFCSAQVKGFAAEAGFTRTDETTWTRTATKAEANEIFAHLPQALRKNTPEGTEWYLRREKNDPETPEAAAARFWRETGEAAAARGETAFEVSPEEVETWLDKNARTGDHRSQTRAAIFEAAEPMNRPALTPRLTEDDLRDILSDTRTDLAAAEEARDKAEQEAHHAKEDSEAAQERIEELEDALEKEEEAHQETKEAAEQGDILSPEHGMTWAEALQEAEAEAEAEAEEARTNPDTGNTWEEDLREAQSTLVEWAEKHDEEKTKREKAEERAKFWEEEHERNRDRISRILDAYFKRDDKAAREAAGAGPFLKAKIRTNAALTTAEEKALIDLIELTEEMADDGTPNGRDAWAGPTADDDETGWRAAAAKKTTDNE